MVKTILALLLSAFGLFAQVNPSADPAFLGQFLPTGPTFTNLTRALYAWYKFDEGSGTTALDSSGNNFHAGWTNSGFTWVAGKVGLAMSFDRSLKPLAVATNFTNIAFPSSGNSGTVTWWSFRTNTYNSGIWENPWGQPGLGAMSLNIYTDNKLYIGLTLGSDHRIVVVNTPSINQLNTWVLYCYSWGPGSTGQRFYTNGVACAIQSDGLGEDAYNNGLPMLIGMDGNAPNTDCHWGGKIDDLRFYTNKLSDAEIDYLYHKWYGQP